MLSDFRSYLVSFPQIDKALRETRFEFLTHDSLLGINDIYEAMKKVANVQYSKIVIENWHRYENDEDSLSQDLFYQYFLSDLMPSSMVILITDEGIREDCGFMFWVDDFYTFSDFYEDHFSMEFFQFSNYLLVSLNQGVLRSMHDEGIIVQYIV